MKKIKERDRNMMKDYMKCQEKYDKKDILIKVTEECGELIQAACKLMTGQVTDMDNLLEEYMDINRMMTVYIQKYASETDIEMMEAMDTAKIKNFIQKGVNK